MVCIHKKRPSSLPPPDIGSDEEENIPQSSPDEENNIDPDQVEYDPRLRDLDFRLGEWRRSNVSFLCVYGFMGISLGIALFTSEYETCCENLRVFFFFFFFFFTSLLLFFVVVAGVFCFLFFKKPAL